MREHRQLSRDPNIGKTHAHEFAGTTAPNNLRQSGVITHEPKDHTLNWNFAFTPASRSGLPVGAANDPLEREADAVAQRVLAGPVPRRTSDHANRLKVQRKCDKCEEEDKQKIAREPAGSGQKEANIAAPAVVHDVLNEPGHPMDVRNRSFFEPRFGRDFSHVRLHTGPLADASARAINAHAFTFGKHIVFSAQRQPSPTPDSPMAHELAHVVQQENNPAGPQVQKQPAGGSGRTVYICTKPILGSKIHRQGHAFFRVGGQGPGNPTFELEHARSCYCGWQGWPRRNVPEDRDADVPCVPTAISEDCLTSNWNNYPVGKYCARGPNSNTYVREISNLCGSKVRPPGNVAGYDASPPPAGGAGAPHPFLSVIACFDVDCDDTECGLVPGINKEIIPGKDPEAPENS